MKYIIIARNFERLENKLKTIENRCRKLNCEFKFEYGKPYWGTYKDERTGEKFPMEYIDVDVAGAPKINGWRAVAALEKRDEGTFIKQFDQSVEIPDYYYHRDPVCEHCKTNRARVYTYIVYNEETGELKQVGKQCLNDFTGGKSAEAIAAYESLLHELENCSDMDDETVSKYSKNTFETIPYLCACLKSYDEDGYHKKLNDDGYQATCYAAIDIYRDDPMDLKTYEPRVKAMLEWLADQQALNSYMNNLKIVCAGEGMYYKNIGIAASLIPAYEKANRKKKTFKRIDTDGMSYFGKAGDRFCFNTDNLCKVGSYNTMYGTTYIYAFTDGDKHYFVWKTSKYMDLTDDDMNYEVKGIIKDHQEYDGVNQTVVKNCRFRALN